MRVVELPLASQHGPTLTLGFSRSKKYRVPPRRVWVGGLLEARFTDPLDLYKGVLCPLDVVQLLVYNVPGFRIHVKKGKKHPYVRAKKKENGRSC